jgi:hypothetical protein
MPGGAPRTSAPTSRRPSWKALAVPRGRVRVASMVFPPSEVLSRSGVLVDGLAVGAPQALGGSCHLVRHHGHGRRQCRSPLPGARCPCPAGHNGAIMRLSRSAALFLLAFGVWTWIIWPTFIRNIWKDPRSFHHGATSFLLVHVALAVVSAVAGTAIGWLGWRGMRVSAHPSPDPAEASPGRQRDRADHFHP